MSVFFRLHQDQSVGTKRSGKWYARAVHMSTINLGLDLGFLDLFAATEAVENLAVVAYVDEALQTVL